jgi:hypothetical protein
VTASEPGERRPGQLSAPPGERYREVPAPPLATRPDLVLAAIWGIVAGLASAAAFALVSLADQRLLLLAVAGAGGVLVGLAVRRGAWSRQPHVGRWTVWVLAVGLALGTWLACQYGAYLLSLATIADSSLSFPERVASQPFLDWLSPQLSPVEIIELFLLAGLAWYSSR